MKADYIHRDTITLENAVIDGKISHIRIYNPNGSSILYTEKYVKEKDKEIERLNKECDTYMKIATKRGNIIDKLEKYINKMIKEDSKYNDVASKYGVLNCKSILNKLKALKEKK